MPPYSFECWSLVSKYFSNREIYECMITSCVFNSIQSHKCPQVSTKTAGFSCGRKKLCQPQLLVAQSKFLSADRGSCKLPVPASSTLPDVFTQIQLNFCFLYGTFRLLKQYKFVILFKFVAAYKFKSSQNIGHKRTL